MLVNQAAHSFKSWFNILPSTSQVINDLKGLKNE
ncbi:hypothetical protein OAX34_03535 [Gammaproteobacteria bacterium]|nr:hypothetical protein [Gammaproteobacteria bacterium]